MEQIKANSKDFEKVDPEIIDTDLYKLQNELSFLEVQNHVSKMFLEEQNKYLQELQKTIENSDDDSSEEDEMEESLFLMQNNLMKLYEEFLCIPYNSDAQKNLDTFVENIESTFINRGLEFDRHLKSFELLCEKQENSEELQRLNQRQANLDAETAKLDLLLIEKKQLDKQLTEMEYQELNELQNGIIELAAFTIKAKKYQEQEQEQKKTVEKLENELSILEAKKKELIEHEEDYLNDNAVIIQVERCQFESFFKDPNDFPYLSSLKKTEDENILKAKVVEDSSAIQDDGEVKSVPKLRHQSTKRVRRNKQAQSTPYVKTVVTSSPKKRIQKQHSNTLKSSDEISIKKLSPPDQAPNLNTFKSPKSLKVNSREYEIGRIDKITTNKGRKRSIDASQDLNILSPIDDAIQLAEPVQESAQSTGKPIIYSSTPKRSKINDDSKIPRILVDASVTTKIPNQSPSNKANILSVEILSYPTTETKICPQSNLDDSKGQASKQEVADSSTKEYSEIKQVETKNKTKDTEVIVEIPKEIIWKSPQLKKDDNCTTKQTLIVEQAQSIISDSCSEISENEHLFNDDFDTCSVKSGTGSDFNFLSPNSNKSFNMDTADNDDADDGKKNAFDFDSFSDSAGFVGESLF